MIKIDPREKNMYIRKKLTELNIPWELLKENLPVGDYKIGDIIIELKFISDLLSSISTGRLNNQLYDMSANYRHSFLVIVGSIEEELLDRKFRIESYVGCLASSAIRVSNEGVKGKISVIVLGDVYQFVHFLRKCYFLSKDFTPRDPKPIKYSSTEETRKLSTFLTLPGVGSSLAKRLMLRFINMSTLCEASIKDIMKTRGLGKEKAKGIFWFLHGTDVNTKI